jgi:hypothetical protein
MYEAAPDVAPAYYRASSGVGGAFSFPFAFFALRVQREGGGISLI